MESFQESHANFIVRLAREFSIDIEKVRAREIIASASEGMMTDLGADPEWLHAAMDTMGLRAKAARMTVANAVQVSRDGALLIAVPVNPRDSLMLVLPGNHRGVRLARGELDDHEVATLDVLAQRIGLRTKTELCDWFVVEKPELVQESRVGNKTGGAFAAGKHHTQSGHGHMKPWRRFLAILSPEWDDIWVVMVFAFFVGALNLATPIAVESLVNTVAFGKFLQPVFVLSLMLFAFLAFSAAMLGLQTFTVELVQRRIFARTVSDLSFRIPRVCQSGLDSVFGPELVNRFFDVPTLQKVVAGLLLDGISLALAMIIGMGVLAFYHPWLLGLDILLLLSVVSGIYLLGRGAVKSGMEESKYKYRIAAWLEDVIRCHRTFKMEGGADFAADRANHLTSGYLSKRKAHFRILIRQVLFVLTLQAIAGTVLLAFGGLLVIRNQMTLGQLVAAELIVAIILGSLAKFGKHIEGFYDALAAADKLGYLFDLPLEEHDGLVRFHPPGPVGVKLSGVNVAIQDKEVFKHPITCSWRAAERVAVVGSRGTGKSTLLELLYALRRPIRGRLEVGGQDPRDLRLSTYRTHVCLVRKNELFTGTIEENIHVHRPGISKQEIRQALNDLGVLNEFLLLPDGLETVILPNGTPLSDQQTCMVLLARAMVAHPKLLLIDGIIDEIHDSEIDAICDAFLSYLGPCTTIIATGRNELVQRCGVVLNLDRLSPVEPKEILVSSDE